MKPEKATNKPDSDPKKKSISSWFFSREEPDKDFVPDLKSQWASMKRNEQVKFVFGALIGLVVFIGALVLVYLLLAAIVGWLGIL